MKYSKHFHYNPDFEWYETEIYLDMSNQAVKLFVNDFISNDFHTTHQIFINVIHWVNKYKKLLQEQCLIRLYGFLPTNSLIDTVQLLSISIESTNTFELLFNHHSKVFITLYFNNSFELTMHHIYQDSM